MQDHPNPRSGSKRSAGTGSLFVRRDANGRESWYGKWYNNRRQIKRRIGLRRIPSTSKGLTRPQAEAELRRLMLEVHAPVPSDAARTVKVAAKSLIEARRTEGCKASTLRTYESLLSTHIEPRLGDMPLHKVTRRDVEQLMASMQKAGKSPKLVVHVLTLLHGTFKHAVREGWLQLNPCEHVRRPNVQPGCVLTAPHAAR